MLFDIVRTLNDQMTMMVRQGMPGRSTPLLFGVTDGYNVQITFMDNLVWDSSTWVTESQDEVKEESRIEQHIKDRISDHLITLYNIQF
jgi:hypothetical protein